MSQRFRVSWLGWLYSAPGPVFRVGLSAAIGQRPGDVEFRLFGRLLATRLPEGDWIWGDLLKILVD
jgi:hypothetical protein